MIFLGDIAIPDNKIADLLGKPKCFGEEIVVGHHSQYIQGFDKDKGIYIIYSLWNWFMPIEIYMQGV